MKCEICFHVRRCPEHLRLVFSSVYEKLMSHSIDMGNVEQFGQW